ncbi:replication initiator [Microbispora catharanthi]|uniref:replication initiator n=1 Tax=Microbispora catharanthi TaxID=1712871 RepID=UPI0026AF54D0
MIDLTDAHQAGGDQPISPARLNDRSTPRAVRMAQPLGRDVVEEIAKQHGVCIRPVPLRRQDILTRQVEVIDVPCGATLESKCPPCAKRNRQLRRAQCREGWHLDHKPVNLPDNADVDAPVAADPDLEPLTRNEARKILEAAKSRRNAARWSVALALGIRQGEALGLRWSFVDLQTGVIKAWYQAQRSPWKHGCDDPHECGKEWHRWPCKPRCRVHKHDPDCPLGCTKRGHVCPTRTCAKDCTGHADRCPKRTGGGIVFRQRKGRSRLTLQCPPELLPILREHKKRQDAERAGPVNSGKITSCSSRPGGAGRWGAARTTRCGRRS